jgi:hypothetical protein
VEFLTRYKGDIKETFLSIPTVDHRGGNSVRRILSGILVIGTLALSTALAEDIRLSGIYSNLFYHKEAGDLLGVEIMIFPTKGEGSSYLALVQIAEGGAPYATLVPVKVFGNKVEIQLPTDYVIPNLRFFGTVSRDSLTGTWNDGKKAFAFGGEGVERLKRGKSYWQQ